MAEGTLSPRSRPPLPRPASPNPKSFPSAAAAAAAPLTYIVQVPKDQIYFTPPKENAALAEQYRAQIASLKKKPSPCLNFLLRFLCFLVSVALFLLIAALVIYIVARPIPPIFSIIRINMESKHQCDVFMEVTNPSIGMGYSIEKGVGRDAKLSYKGEILADGEPPLLKLKAMELTRFVLELSGVKKKVLEEVEKSLQGERKAAALKLTATAPMRPEIWGVGLWEMKMTVECEVRLKILAEVTTVFSQDCKVVIGLV